jgi:hypothetical protein
MLEIEIWESELLRILEKFTIIESELEGFRIFLCEFLGSNFV